MSEYLTMSSSANGVPPSAEVEFSNDATLHKEMDEEDYNMSQEMETEDALLAVESSSVSTDESTLTANSLPVVSAVSTMKDPESTLSAENALSSSSKDLDLTSPFISSEVPAQMFTDSPSDISQQPRDIPDESSGWTSLEESKAGMVENVLSDSGTPYATSRVASFSTALEAATFSSVEVNMEVADKVDGKKNQQSEVDVTCRLCAMACVDSTSVQLFCGPPHNTQGSFTENEGKNEVLAIIKATLPIKVSCCDSLPKQVCHTCVERLRAWNTFTTTVIEADNHFQTLSSSVAKKALPNGSVSSNLPYNCPICCDDKMSSSLKRAGPNLLNPLGKRSHDENISWGEVIVKIEPEELPEPSSEEMERTYHKLFRVQHNPHQSWTEERLALQPKKPIPEVVRRPRGRPRTRPKVTPRGRRGRRSTHTTVERILELTRNPFSEEGSSICVRSGEGSSISQALTQCLLCERWLPGAAACLQHCLAEHTDCGAFLCPRCPRDDFPGEFELIQHFQEAHCPDLELYEICETESTSLYEETTAYPGWEMDGDIHTSQPVPPAVAEQQMSSVQQHLTTQPPPQEQSLHQDMDSSNLDQEESWQVERMEFEHSNTNTPSHASQEPDESQDDVSSNLSEPAPRSLTSHSAIYEEESNSILTQESDSNLVLQEHSASEQPCDRPEDISEQLPDQLLDQESMSDTSRAGSGRIVEPSSFVDCEEEDDDAEDPDEKDDLDDTDNGHSCRKNNDDNDDKDDGNSGNSGANHDTGEGGTSQGLSYHKEGSSSVSENTGKDEKNNGDGTGNQTKQSCLSSEVVCAMYQALQVLCLLCRHNLGENSKLCSNTSCIISAEPVLDCKKSQFHSIIIAADPRGHSSDDSYPRPVLPHGVSFQKFLMVNFLIYLVSQHREVVYQLMTYKRLAFQATGLMSAA